MAHTAFPNEKVLYSHPTGETLCETDGRRGRQFVAVASDGFRTDYPISSGFSVLWDNPEYFTADFRKEARRIILDT